MHPCWRRRYEDGVDKTPQLYGFTTIRDATPSILSHSMLHTMDGIFLELPICEDWQEHEEKQLITDYIAYKAPQMLMLPGLNNTTRDRLEQVAVKQADVVERLWRLYPEIHNKELLNSARIEAKIHSANRK